VQPSSDRPIAKVGAEAQSFLQQAGAAH